MENLKVWWSQASSRDQLSLMVLGIAFIVFVLFQFVLLPVADMREKQQARVAAQQEAYERVKNLAARWKASSSGGTSQQADSGIERAIETSFAQHGVRVSGFDASGRSGIRVRFDSVQYENLLAWLHEIEIEQAMHFKDVSVAGSSDPGLVSANILIQKN